MNRSIDLLEEMAEACDNRFLMNRRGYLYATADPDRAESMRVSGVLASSYGTGPLRIHAGSPGGPDYRPVAGEDWRDQPDGADLILDQAMLRQEFPYLSADTIAVLHTRRCGWFSGQQLGMLQLEQARTAGVAFVEGRVVSISTQGGRVASVVVETPNGTIRISTPRFVDAAGPMLGPVAALLGLELPVFSELHLKVSIEDHLEVVPRDAPLLIWEDPQHIGWDPDECEALAASDTTRLLIEEMPAGVHLRTEGAGSSRHVIILWPYHAERVPEVFPLPVPDHYAEVCVRGMTAMIPGFDVYRERLPKPFIDGGYYTKTRENRPLAGPLPIEGAFIHGALSGFGLMASSATAELVAAHMTGSALPDYAGAFHPARFDDPEYLAKTEDWDDTTQL
jgi:sarcosine oxidase subunit beta